MGSFHITVFDKFTDSVSDLYAPLQPDTIMRIRTDYVHEQQSRYRTAIVNLEQRINGASTSERVKLTSLQAQATEIHDYEEKIYHLADR